MYSVCAIYNFEYSKLYIGQTEDSGARLILHNNKTFANSYTARFDGKWVLIYSEKLSDRQSALKREKELKSYKGHQFLKTRIIPA